MVTCVRDHCAKYYSLAYVLLCNGTKPKFRYSLHVEQLLALMQPMTCGILRDRRGENLYTQQGGLVLFTPTVVFAWSQYHSIVINPYINFGVVSLPVRVGGNFGQPVTNWQTPLTSRKVKLAFCATTTFRFLVRHSSQTDIVYAFVNPTTEYMRGFNAIYWFTDRVS